MSFQNFPRKSGISIAIPLALVVLLLAAPVNGQEVGTSDTAVEAKATETPPKATESAQAASDTLEDNTLQVTADRIRQPLAEPNMQTRLPRIYLSDMQPWNWNGMWHASEWANGDSTIPWKYGRVRQAFGGDTHFVLNAAGAPELKAQKGHPSWSTGMYEVDVTIPDMRPGLIASPILLFNDRTQESIAIQIVGKRQLQFTVHGAPEGIRKSEEFSLAGDYSGRRMKLAIRRHTQLGLIDFFVDGELVHSLNDTSPAFPQSAMRPIISMHAADKHGWAKQWAGTWQGLAGDERIRMTVHGYRATPLK